MKLFPNKYKIENTVEATFPSSYSSLFYIQLSNTWRWLYKTTIKFPGVFKQESRMVTGNFLASFRKHLYRSLRKNKHAESAYAFSAFFRWLLWPTVTGSTSTVMSARWHFTEPWLSARFWNEFDITNICSWQEHAQNRWFVTRFREHGIPSTWRRKNSCSENISVPVSLLLKTKQRNQNRYFT